MNPWIHPHWQSVLSDSGLSSFDAMWQIEAALVESPNQGRGGSSGVSLLELRDESGKEVRLFLKRQVNHLTHGLGPIGRFPTVRREFRNLRQLENRGFLVPQVVFFGERKSGPEWQAVLVTCELEDRISLWELLESGVLPVSEWGAGKQKLIRAVATVVRRLHQSGYRHGSLYPKHIFIDPRRLGAEPALIDLEKMRRTPFRQRARTMDLDALNRRTPQVTRSDRLLFLSSYLGLSPSDARVREWWKKLAARALDRRKAT